MKIDKVLIHCIPSHLNLVKATLSQIFYSRFLILLLLHLLFFFLFLQSFSLYFSFRETVREPIFPRNVHIPTRGRNREGNSIGALFYKYLSSFESIRDQVLLSLFSFLLFSYSLVHGLFPSSRPNSQACICSCKSFIRFVRGFASITAMGRPEPALSSRLYFSSHSVLCSPFIPFLFPVPLFSPFVMTRPIFVNFVCFSNSHFLDKAELVLLHLRPSYLSFFQFNFFSLFFFSSST